MGAQQLERLASVRQGNANKNLDKCGVLLDKREPVYTNQRIEQAQQPQFVFAAQIPGRSTPPLSSSARGSLRSTSTPPVVAYNGHNFSGFQNAAGHRGSKASLYSTQTPPRQPGQAGG